MQIDTFTPIGPRLLVEKVDLGEQMIGRLVIAQTQSGAQRWKPCVMRVLHAGTGRMNDHLGKRDEPRYWVGQLVLMPNETDLNIRVAGEERFIITEDAVLGVVTLTEEPVAAEAAAG